MWHPSHCRNDFFPIQKRWHNNNLLGDPSLHSLLRTQTRPFNDLFQSLRHWHLDDNSWHGNFHDLFANRVRHLLMWHQPHHTYDFFPYQRHKHTSKTCAKLLCNLWDGAFYDPSTNPLRTSITLQYQTHHLKVHFQKQRALTQPQHVRRNVRQTARRQPTLCGTRLATSTVSFKI